MHDLLAAVSLDDDRSNLLLIEQMASEAGLAVSSFLHPQEAINHIQANSVDLVFVDSRMPELDGVGFIRKLRPHHPDVPIVVITEVDGTEDLRSAALEAGATEFLSRPLNSSEFVARVRSVTQLRKSNLIFRDWSRLLQKEVDRATVKVLEREYETIHVFARAAERGDVRTANHVSRVTNYARILARAAGEKEFQQSLVFKSAALHDVGMIGVPQTVITKPDGLTNEEFGAVKAHPWIGFELMRDSSSVFLQTASTIALTHHERFDGSGYPKGIRGEGIPLFGRICAIADVFDALVSQRPYRDPWTLEKAFAYIDGQKGAHFDPRLADLFLAERDGMRSVLEAYRDPNP
jgi:response regulator RpfG family c-di-GMP phosphodiesterase